LQDGPHRTVAIVNASDHLDGVAQGIEPYFSGLAHLGYPVRWYQCVDFRGDGRAPDGGIPVRGLGFPLRGVDMGINRLWVFPRRLRGLKEATILLADPTLARILPSHPRVIVHVHDLRPLTQYSDRFSTRMMYRNVLPRLRRAWRILVPSNYVRRQLLEMDFDPGRIRLLPETHRLGMHPDHLAVSRQRIAERRETRVLYVGTDRPYKNVELVLELAHRMASRTDHHYSFTIVSRLRSRTRRQMADLGLGGVRVLSDVESMARVYEANDVLVFPSRYEGFGRPLIEAMAYGLPILANGIEPVAEVLGNGGILLDDRDGDAWVRALGSLEDPSTFESYGLRSLERGRTYLPEQFERALPDVFGNS
jgi:glycosyltransferase involved in cell wall biosynthesis